MPQFFKARPRPLPRDFRQLLLAFAKTGDLSFDAFLDRFDYTGVTPHQLYATALSRLPESARVAVPAADYAARQQLGDMLRSPEFQGGLMARVARAFPEKQRLIFVHVPKCAGTDLAAHLMAGFPHLAQRDQDAAHVPYEQLPSRFQELMTAFSRSDKLVLMGHIGLDWVTREQLMRHGDVAFSVIRDPVGMALSKVNYVLTQLLGRGDQPPSHFGPWMESLGLAGFPQALGDDEAREEARRFLRDPKIVPDNVICRFLGRGDSASALDLCASCDIELTTASRYPQWLRQRWGINSQSRLNPSRPYLRREELTASDLQHIDEITREDARFYTQVDDQLKHTNRTALSGVALAEHKT